MKEITKKVKLLKPFDANKINIRRDRYFSNAYIVDLPLDSTPNHVWRDIFERNWKSSRHLWDRKIFVMGDKLRLITTADEFEDKLDWIEQVIRETNRSIDEYNLSVQKEGEIRIKEESKKQTEWRERTEVERIREALRKRLI